jgi:Ca2+-binding EF-hand superfamily protein
MEVDLRRDGLLLDLEFLAANCGNFVNGEGWAILQQKLTTFQGIRPRGGAIGISPEDTRKSSLNTVIRFYIRPCYKQHAWSSGNSPGFAGDEAQMAAVTRTASDSRNHLSEVFTQHQDHGTDKIDKAQLLDIFKDYGVDDEFAPALQTVLAPGGKSEISREEWQNFFDILSSGDPRQFQLMLFDAIKVNGKNGIDYHDLKKFGSLIGEPIDEKDAQELINAITGRVPSPTDKEPPSATWEQFWNWYQREHGIQYDRDDPPPRPERLAGT